LYDIKYVPAFKTSTYTPVVEEIVKVPTVKHELSIRFVVSKFIGLNPPLDICCDVLSLDKSTYPIGVGVPTAPVAPVAPVSPVPVAPVAPVAPVDPVAPVSPVPVAPVSPVTPLILDCNCQIPPIFS